jgi:hydroxymethylglutaryl-CoA lyase
MTRASVEIVEVGVRDGLQNESRIFTTLQKIDMVRQAIGAGIKRIEVASFVNPKLVPQMADAERVVKELPRHDDVTYVGLVLNKRGYFRAIEARDEHRHGLDEIGCVAVASDTFGQKNQGMTRLESLTAAKEVIKLGNLDALPTQVTISASFGCPFEGDIDPKIVIDMCKSLAEVNPKEIAIADTIGVAGPGQVEDLFSAVSEAIPHIQLRAHFHNTRNTGIASSWAAYQGGARVIDASIGGLGGCPFAPNATGNIATEDLVFMLNRSGVETGVDVDKLIEITKWLEGIFEKPLPSALAKAGNFPRK